MRRLLVLMSGLALFVACQYPGCMKGPLKVDPSSARPGEKIHLRQRLGSFQSYGSLRVTIGGEPSHVSRVISNTEMDVVVPMRPPGNVRIELYAGNELAASAPFEVLDTDCMRLVLQLHGTQVSILRAERCFDTVQRPAQTLKARLSFDVVNSAGQTLYTTTIPHPFETKAEVHTHSSRGATVQRHDVRDPAVFWIRFPKLPNAKGLRVYYVPPGLDLADSTNLDNRVPIDTLDATGHSP